MSRTEGEEGKLRRRTDGEWKSLMLTILTILEFMSDLFCLLVKSSCYQLIELLVYAVST